MNREEEREYEEWLDEHDCGTCQYAKDKTKKCRKRGCIRAFVPGTEFKDHYKEKPICPYCEFLDRNEPVKITEVKFDTAGREDWNCPIMYCPVCGEKLF